MKMMMMKMIQDGMLLPLSCCTVIFPGYRVGKARAKFPFILNAAVLM